MRLALYNDHRPGLVDPAAGTITAMAPDIVPPPGSDSALAGAGWWVRMCAALHHRLPSSVPLSGPAMPLTQVSLRSPVLRPGKIIAAASNYAEHIAEMRDEVLPRTGVASGTGLLDFDVFLKAPTSVCGPAEEILLPSDALAAGTEIHHEGELAVVIGQGGRDISPGAALRHVLGYLPALDITARGSGDRSRRKSHDTFTPLGPWITTADEIPDWRALRIELQVNGQPRQQITAGTMLHGVEEIISYASQVMRLEPGDVILTGAPPGVGPIWPGEQIEMSISELGTLRVPVRAR